MAHGPEFAKIRTTKQLTKKTEPRREPGPCNPSWSDNSPHCALPRGVSESAACLVRLLRQAEQHLHDSRVLVRGGVNEQAVIDKALNCAYRTAGWFPGRTNDRNGTKLLAQQESRLRHDEVGLKQVGNF